MILAGDIGGTKTLLGLFDAATARPHPLVVRSFGTLDHPDLQTMIAGFLNCADAVEALAAHGRITAACFGVAGPVVDGTVKVTNVPWFVDGRRVAAALGLPRVALLNDLEALAHAVPTLRESETHVLQEGEPLRGGNIGLIAAGTGLGQALLHNIDGRFVPSASEAGHADFAARTEREIALTRDLVRATAAPTSSTSCRAGASSTSIASLTASRAPRSGPGVARRAWRDLGGGARAPVRRLRGDARHVRRGLRRGVRQPCAALGVHRRDVHRRRHRAKLLAVLTTGAFMRAFLAKPPLDRMLSAMPVKVILNAESGLLGAAVYASNQRS
jgi:Glucokinase